MELNLFESLDGVAKQDNLQDFDGVRIRKQRIQDSNRLGIHFLEEAVVLYGYLLDLFQNPRPVY